MTATLAAIRTRALALAERRLPALTRLRQAERLPIRLDRRRIYVLPTGFGLMFALLMFGEGFGRSFIQDLSVAMALVSLPGTLAMVRWLGRLG